MPNISRWRNRLPLHGTDASLRDWLRETGSLTARLQRSGRFRLTLLSQRLHRANPDEEESLALPSHARCWVREVLLHCNDRPVIFAHTVLPAEPRGVLSRWLAGLGGRSLGSLLFAHPGFVRGAIEYCRLDTRHPLYRRVAAVAPVGAVLWARRSRHRLGAQEVLVTEVFLPAIADIEAGCGR